MIQHSRKQNRLHVGCSNGDRNATGIIQGTPWKWLIVLALIAVPLFFTGCRSIPQGTSPGSVLTKAQIQHAMGLYRANHPARCEVCGKLADPTRVLEIHHMKPREAFPELAADTNNMILVDRNCHLYVCHNGDFGKYVANLRKMIEMRKVLLNRRQP